MRFRTSLLFFVIMSLTIAPTANAHFAWLMADKDGHAVFFFGESIAERTYHLPEKLSDVEIHAWSAEGERQDVEMAKVETDSLIGRRSNSPAKASVLSCVATYGLYQGSKLTYHCQHVAGEPTSWPDAANAELSLQAIVKTQDDGGVVVTVFAKGKPLTNAKVQLFCDEGHEEGEATTDDKGQVSFTNKQVEDGLNGILVGHVDPKAKGELDGTDYTGEANYLSVTFYRP